MKGQKITAPHEEAPRGAKVIDLMAALRKSIGDKEGAKAKGKAPTKKKAAPKRSAAKKRA